MLHALSYMTQDLSPTLQHEQMDNSSFRVALRLPIAKEQSRYVEKGRERIHKIPSCAADPAERRIILWHVSVFWVTHDTCYMDGLLSSEHVGSSSSWLRGGDVAGGSDGGIFAEFFQHILIRNG